MNNVVKDEKGRILISVNDKGRIAISRYVEMDVATKDYVAETYSNLSGEDMDDVMAFLNFEVDTDLFCA